MADALAVHDLRKRYGATEALKGVDLTVGEGELVGLLGPERSREVDAGEDRLRARAADDRGTRRQRRPAHARLSRRAVPLPGLAERGRAAAAAPEARELAAAARASGASCSSWSGSARCPTGASGAMSKGMQQRLGIAQAMIGEPQLLLLDEPTSALDPAGRRTVRELLERLRERGVAVLLNSHLLSRGRAGLRPRGDHRARRGGRGGHAGRALARRRRGGRDRPRHADVRAGHARGRPADRARAGARRARTSTRCASCAPRSRTPTSKWSAADEGRGDHRGLRAARVGAPARVRRRGAADRRVPRALRPRRLADLHRRPTRSAAPRASTGESSPGATLLGLSMFATLFLGAILAVFLTLGAVRGDAERGLLQPLLVRPLPRATFLLGRFAAAAGVCVVYVIARLPRLGRDHATASSTGGRTGCSCPRSSSARGVAVIAALALGGLGRALEHRQRHRDLHALRRRADRGPARARSPRRCPRTRSRTSPASRRGCCRSRRSTSRR